MDLPDIKRYGDTWTLTYGAQQIAFGIEQLAQTRDDLVARVTVESRNPICPGRLIGPVRLNLLAMQSQASFAKALEQRIKGLPWTEMVIAVCAIVVKQFTVASPTVDLSEVDLEATRMDHLIAGLVPLGETTFAYGDSESMKSTLAQLIGVCVLQGLALPWGVIPTRKLKVLYCDWETTEAVLAERTRRLALGLCLDVRPRMLYRGTLRGRDASPLRTLVDEVGNLREQIQREEIGLVIIDSIGFAVDGKLVDDDVARAAMAALRQLTPATRLVVAHISKESAAKQNGRVDPFGSAFFRAGIRSGFEVRRSEEDSTDDVDVGIYHWKSNEGAHVKPFGLRFHFEPNGGAISVRTRGLEDVPDLAMRTSLSARLRAALKGGAKAVHELAEELDADPKTIGQTLRRMPDAVRLDGGGRGEPATWGLRANE